jgi:hypothetical protein
VAKYSFERFGQPQGEHLSFTIKSALRIIAAAALFPAVCFSQTGIDQITKTIGSFGHRGLSNDKIVAGLKEALKVSTGKAVAATGKPDGFLKNEAIRILLPEKLRAVGQGMRLFGMSSQVDELEVGMNRAAEQAAPAAEQIFIDAVLHMTFEDARQILSGGDTAATEYFKQQSSADLTTAFTPIVHRAMEDVGVMRQYDKVIESPMASRFAENRNFNLDSYVVAKTLDGLFYMLGQEEKRIRQDPAAQTTSLLKEVFGKLKR